MQDWKNIVSSFVVKTYLWQLLPGSDQSFNMKRLPKHITKIIPAKIMQKLSPKMDAENFHDAVMFYDCS